MHRAQSCRQFPPQFLLAWGKKARKKAKNEKQQQKGKGRNIKRETKWDSRKIKYL